MNIHSQPSDWRSSVGRRKVTLGRRHRLYREHGVGEGFTFFAETRSTESAPGVGWTSISGHFEDLQRLRTQVAELKRRLSTLEGRVASLELAGQEQQLAYLTSAAPEPYQIKRPIPIHIRRLDGDDAYEASFFDANIHTGGDTAQEAYDNLRSLILDLLDVFTKVSHEELGPEPARQYAVLSEFIERWADEL